VTASTTWIGNNAARAAVCLPCRRLRVNKGEADMLKVYETRYQENIELLKVTSAGRSRGDAYRDGQFKVPVQK
jgi:hypothetical protein